MPDKHARLSPSASDRWLTCPASIRVGQQFSKGKESAYALEGTAAHALAELKARHRFWPDESKYRAEYTEWLNEYRVAGEPLIEMARHTEAYVNLLWERTEEGKLPLFLEQRLDTGVPTCWGTSDAVIIGADHVEIVDLKYGAGIIVTSEENSQLMLYALGALDEYGDVLGPTEDVRMTIFQPRAGLGDTDSWSIKAEELREWRSRILPIAEEALGDDAHFQPSEKACRWCPASGMCRAQMEWATKMDFYEPPDTLEPQETADWLGKIQFIRQWCDALANSALDAAYSQGTVIPGWKPVMSRGNRRIVDPEGAVLALTEHGYTAEQVAEMKVKPLGALEKLVGKDALPDILGATLGRNEGKPSLVPEDDPRPAINPNHEAQKEFNDV